MENKFLNGLNATNEFGYTENGAVKRTTTGSELLNMFSLGGAYRSRSEEDVILLFKKAYDENPRYALKCLFYLRDVRGGQGERRFFRICMKWLVSYDREAARRNMKYIAEYGRWDDLYVFLNTALEADMFAIIREQLGKDVQTKTPSLLAKWLPSENTSSKETCARATRTRKALGMTHKQYRKTLSILRERINVLERLMSANEWDKIEFDKIPSKAGMIYKEAFIRHDLERSKENAQTYEQFIKDENTKVNAKTLYPYECVNEVFKSSGPFYRRNQLPIDDTNRMAINKYWDNLADYFNGCSFNGMAVVDTSGSMMGNNADAPLNIAISLGLYCADKAKGPFAGHFMTFSSNPKFVKTEGVDFYDKVNRMVSAEWGGSTNVEAAFDLMLETAIKNKCRQDEIPQSLIIISDMEFDYCATSNAPGPISFYGWNSHKTPDATLFEAMEKKWNAAGYKMPTLTFWNVQARHDGTPMRVKDGVNLVSGASPSIFKMVMENKNAFDLMYEVLDNERYSVIG
jgi:hypothetical protein